MRIQHNVMAMNAYRNYSNNTKALSKNLERLSSGYKINRAGDDAAGLAISEKMRAQITGLEAAQKNVKDGISLVNTAEGAMQEVQDMLNRMVYLAQESANGTYDNEVDRMNLQKELDQLNSEIDRIADSANFNGIKLLDGSLGFNKEAFVIGDPVEAAAGVAVTDVIGAMPAAGHSTAAAGATGAATILHGNGDVAKAGEFTIDVSGMAATPAAAGKTASVNITINSKTYTIAADAADTPLDGKTIATKLAAEINKDNTNKGLLIGTADKTGLIYEAEDLGNGMVKLTSKYDGAGTALTDGKPTKDTADAALQANWTVSTAQTSADTNLTIDENHNVGTIDITAPVKPSDSKFGNTAVTFDMSKIADGMVLEIAGEKYTFAVGANSSYSGDGVVDLKDLDLTQSADRTEAMNRLTKAAADNATFTVGHDGAGKLTLAERTDAEGQSTASAEMQKAMTTLTDFQKLVTLTGPATKAATTLTVNQDAVKTGDGVTVGDTTYVFTDKTDLIGKTYGKTKYLDKAEAAENLATALTADGYNATNDNGALTIEAKVAGATEGPAVLGKGLTLQIGDTSDPYNQLSVVVGDIHSTVLGVGGGKISIADQQSAADAVDKIKAAINQISSIRGTLGATSNRLDHTANNLSVMRENITDAESAIRDTDIAEEMMAYTKNNILVQSAQAMLAQANQVPQGVLQLLQ